MNLLSSLPFFGGKKEPVMAPKNILRPRPFDPAAVFGHGWADWRGPPEGDGLHGDIECDSRSYAATWALDLSQAELDIRLRPGENWLGCEEWRKRLLAEKADFVRLGPEFALALREEPNKWPWGNKVVFFDGRTLRGPRGYRCVVYAYRGGAEVFVYYYWLDSGRRAGRPSALLAKHLVPRA